MHVQSMVHSSWPPRRSPRSGAQRAGAVWVDEEHWQTPGGTHQILFSAAGWPGPQGAEWGTGGNDDWCVFIPEDWQFGINLGALIGFHADLEADVSWFWGEFSSSEFCEQKMLGFTKKDGTANHFKEIWWVYNWERMCSGIVPKSGFIRS